ncbi:hypothetical protein PV08_07474 [Exophiala spinifera]|uniref:Shugoshin C-terminal domain-containing protein n=1 Tax=Exophiala spinifera TaxID=91928 RepID=A0A0D2B7M7_9EURO|nr:uncharacterized protein PV08_07474 [Exophiala spinifera]KIW14690.1 hypothetical protein PV08_07474 [Exophiala spinifera]
MARLNDPPAPPTESIDALKRRFIRQNREIARVNSTQSQRIRNMETEISRLVAENVSLREQAIAAKAEADRWRKVNFVSQDVMDMKDRLQNKVNEMAMLLIEMGDLPEKAARKTRRKSRTPTESLAEQEWKYRQSIREATALEKDAQEGRLPVIMEDKQYPRRTLENAEILYVRNAGSALEISESPEIGPPPVAHFDVNEEVSYDNPRQSLEGTIEDQMQISATVEKRRKRRTSALLQDMQTEEAAEPTKSTPMLLKTGAKRKLDVSELEEPALRPNEDDEFVFRRTQDAVAGVGAGKKPSRFTRAPGRENQMLAETKIPSPQKSMGDRKILAPKTTNSPSKRKIVVSQKLDPDPRSNGENQRPTNGKPSRRTTLPPPLPVKDIIKDTEKADEANNLPPKTPAAQDEDILSPISTEPSTRTTHHAKEAAISNSVEDVLNGSIGRGSRRARPAVSYALPNLRDKMRRPTKELVGAVEGIEKQRDTSGRTSIRLSSADRVNSEEPQSAVGQIKQEATGVDEKWKEFPMKKDEPTSPLRDKERKEVARGRPTKRDEAQTEPKHERQRSIGEQLKDAVDRLSIYDPPISSPIEEPQKASKAPRPRRTTFRSSYTKFFKLDPSAYTLITDELNVQSPSITARLCSKLKRRGVVFISNFRGEALEQRCFESTYGRDNREQRGRPRPRSDDYSPKEYDGLEDLAA